MSRPGQAFRRLSKKARGPSTVAVSGSGDVEEVGKELEGELFDDGDDDDEQPVRRSSRRAG